MFRIKKTDCIQYDNIVKMDKMIKFNNQTAGRDKLARYDFKYKVFKYPFVIVNLKRKICKNCIYVR